jgi:hypothetical protein
VHGLRDFAFDVVCLDARHARAALKMQINKKMTLKDWLKSFVWSVHVKGSIATARVCDSRRKDATGRHDSPAVEPHSWGAQDVRSAARSNARIAFRSESRGLA